MKKSALLLLLPVCLVAIFCLFRPASPPPVAVLHRPYRAPLLVRDRLGSWIPSTPGWNWARHLEQIVFGKRKPVNFSAELVSLPAGGQEDTSRLWPGTAHFAATNGMLVWLLGPGELKALHNKVQQTYGVEVLYRPRISTADGIGNRLFVGQSIPLRGTTNNVGLAVDFYARVASHSTDVYADIWCTALVTNQPTTFNSSLPVPEVSIQTNLDAGLRVQVPHGKGLFLMGRTRPHMSGRCISIFIDPPVPAK